MSDDDKAPGPAMILAEEIVTSTSAQMTFVVVVLGTEDGMIGIDAATAHRALPPAAAKHMPALLEIIAGLRDDVERHMKRFHEQSGMRRGGTEDWAVLRLDKEPTDD